MQTEEAFLQQTRVISFAVSTPSGQHGEMVALSQLQGEQITPFCRLFGLDKDTLEMA